jgi:hypothetical protein
MAKKVQQKAHFIIYQLIQQALDGDITSELAYLKNLTSKERKEIRQELDYWAQHHFDRSDWKP